MGIDATKPIFGVSHKTNLKPVSPTTEASEKIENLHAASLDMILSNKRIAKSTDQTALVWALLANPEDRFSRTKARMIKQQILLFVKYRTRNAQRVFWTANIL